MAEAVKPEVPHAQAAAAAIADAPHASQVVAAAAASDIGLSCMQQAAEPKVMHTPAEAKTKVE